MREVHLGDDGEDMDFEEDAVDPRSMNPNVECPVSFGDFDRGGVKAIEAQKEQKVGGEPRMPPDMGNFLGRERQAGESVDLLLDLLPKGAEIRRAAVHELVFDNGGGGAMKRILAHRKFVSVRVGRRSDQRRWSHENIDMVNMTKHKKIVLRLFLGR